MTQRIVAVLAVVLVAGCSIGPDYERPETPTPEGWQTPRDQAGTWPSVEWWQAFGAPPLDRLMVRAREANHDLAAAMARVRQADAQARIAGAPLLPTIKMQADAQRARSILTVPKSGNYPKKQLTFDDIFSISYVLDFWGANADAAEAAEDQARASRFSQQTTTLTVQASVANTYFALLGLQDRIKVASGNLANAEHVLEAFRARVAAGTAGGLDVAQQESVVAEQRATLAPLTQQLRQNTNALAILVGQLPQELKLDGGSLDDIAVPPVSPGLPSQLLTRRPDVQLAEAQLMAASATLKQAYAAVFPTITLTGQGGLESRALSNMLEPNSVLYSLAASLAQPIFQGGAIESGKELQKARVDELQQNYRKAVISAFSDVENGLIAVAMTAEQQAAQQAAVETAQRANDIAQAQLFSGTIDIMTVLNTQRTLFQAQDLLVQAKLLHAQAVVSLFMALGGGWQMEQP